ncbi:universal stress protein [Streptomyces glaucescens]|uniref:universal stress protein n=1 Tax=Streptomyces glaucescens TaxID=1907 RepID=UPI00344E2773
MFSVRPVVVGLDDRCESPAAAEWAAREALSRNALLRLVHAGKKPPVHPGERPPRPQAFAADVRATPSEADRPARLLAGARKALEHRHPGLRVTADRLDADVVPALLAAADEAELLVVGTRRPGRAAGLVRGSVSHAVVARAGCPVVLVPARAAREADQVPEASGGAASPGGDIVLGVGPAGPEDAVLRCAFDAAVRRGAGVRVVYGGMPARDEPDTAVALLDADGEPLPRPVREALRPWREKFPGVAVTGQAVIGLAGSHLADASGDAALLIVGRTNRATAVGTLLGPVIQTVLHHTRCPVAVVPHD